MGHRISIAAEVTTAHLSNCISMSHARQKRERYMGGKHSPQEDRERADDYVRRVGDQIEMALEAALERTETQPST